MPHSWWEISAGPHVANDVCIRSARAIIFNKFTILSFLKDLSTFFYIFLYQFKIVLNCPKLTSCWRSLQSSPMWTTSSRRLRLTLFISSHPSEWRSDSSVICSHGRPDWNPGELVNFNLSRGFVYSPSLMASESLVMLTNAQWAETGLTESQIWKSKVHLFVISALLISIFC